MKPILITLLLLAATMCRAQGQSAVDSAVNTKRTWLLGANVHLILDGIHTVGGSAEIGLPGILHGTLFVQVSALNRNDLPILYRGNQTFQVLNSQYIVPGSKVDGVTVSPPSSAETTYLPYGIQYGANAEYCYPVTPWLMVGPLVGLVLQTLHEIASYNDVAGYYYAVPDKLVQTAFLPNFGGVVKLSLTPVISISLGFATQTGAAIGADFVAF